VIDRSGLTATLSYTIAVANVNDPPYFTSTPITSAMLDTRYTYTMTVNDLDLMWGDVLTVSAATQPGWLDFTQTGTITWSLTGIPTPTLGAFPVNLIVTDTAGLTSTQRFTITVYDKLFKLMVHIIGGGSVSIDPDKPGYAPHDVITLTATTGWSWGFVGWSGGLIGTERVKVFTIESNMDITAAFIQKQIFLPRVSK